MNMFANDAADNDNGVYYFPDEGCVDPIDAVDTIQREGRRLGVEYRYSHNVERFIVTNEETNADAGAGDDGKSNGISITGVVCSTVNHRHNESENFDGKGSSKDEVTIHADVVVVAAGVKLDDILSRTWQAVNECSNNVGNESPKLLSSDRTPGQIVFVSATDSSDDENGDAREGGCDEAAHIGSGNKLNRLLVDMVQSCHVLQRRDGTVVVGGGTLVVGGSSDSSTTSGKDADTYDTAEGSAAADDERLIAESLLERARSLVPDVLTEGPEVSTRTPIDPKATNPNYRWATAIRPMPRDGLPIVGFHNNWLSDGCDGTGVYLLVTHSAMTLGPLLGALAAVEIAEQSTLELLEPYRPTRFHT